MICHACGSPMMYYSKRIKCRGHERCQCDVKSSIPVALAEQKIVQAIRERLQLDTVLFQRLYQCVLDSHREFSSCVPQELASKERELKELEQRISRLVDNIESGDALPDVNERLQKRYQERAELQRDIARLKTSADKHTQIPTEDWVREQLDHMQERLVESGADANEALKNLIDGPISVVETGPEKKRGRAMRGQFRLNVRCLMAGQSALSGEGSDSPTEDLISIDFVDDQQIETHQCREVELQDRAKQLFDQGLLNVEIAEQLGVAKSSVTKLIKNWHTRHELPVPNGSIRRFQLARSQRIKHLYQSISDRVMEMYHEGRLLAEIADEMDVDCNTITSSIAYWHQSRGLPIPDGRTRRKKLTRKSR